MSIVIEKLLEDHRNIAKLLRLLEQQVSQLKSGEFTDFPLMTNIMHYFANYPEIHHHHYEDLIFDILKQKDRTHTDTIRHIRDEHELMAKTSSKLHDEVAQLQGNAVFSRDELVQQFSDYIAMYYAHMRKEEDELFSQATHTLNEKEWRNIDTEVKLDNDPLYGSILDKQYESLYQSIISMTKT